MSERVSERPCATVPHPAINDRRADMRWALEQKLPAEAVAAAAEALFGERDARSALELLLPLLSDPRPVVRLGAIRGLADKPYAAVLAALYRLADRDPNAKVGKTAQDVVTRLDAPSSIACIECGLEGAKLAPKESADPHDSGCTRPMFCDEHCAAQWALDRARDEHHLCLPTGTWHLGVEDECNECLENARLGTDDAEPAEAGAAPCVLVSPPKTCSPRALRPDVLALAKKAKFLPREVLSLVKTTDGRAAFDDLVKRTLAKEAGQRSVIAGNLLHLDDGYVSGYLSRRHPEIDACLRAVSASLKRGVAAGWAVASGRWQFTIYRASQEPHHGA